ncbi:MAG TPA: hypothetical protein VFA72_06645 [Burkholderiales bacterium]|jgi:hypothetical protein|nr:hypothetical protein [Burkholderiales bacterium]
MMYRSLIATLLVGLACGCASKSDPGLAQAAPAPTPPAQTYSWMDSRDYAVEGLIPSMERGRKVNEQDCTKPVDPRAGNLRCK